MKSVPSFILLLSVIFTTSCSVSQSTSQENPLVFEQFYQELSPYGVWMESAVYGMVWHPYTNPDFRPYVTNGSWIATDQGWAWSSGYRWGWATFHYGRWYYEPPYGWLWQPGYEWSPAWVTWGYADDYYCWAPLMPGVSVTITYVSWNPPPFYWNGCLRRHITRRNIGRSVLRPEPLAIIRPRIRQMNNYNTTRENSHYYAAGPDISEVQKYAPRKIRTTSISSLRTSERSQIIDRRPRAQSPADRQAPQRNRITPSTNQNSTRTATGGGRTSNERKDSRSTRRNAGGRN